MNAAFTIVTTNYISYAKTLGESIKRFNPNYVFFICLIDGKADLNNLVKLDEFKLLEISELNDVESIQLMLAKYNVFELSCALKPFFAEHIIKYNAVSRLKYLDSDMMVFNTFDSSLEENSIPSIMLTPHFFTPVAPVENTTNDATLLKSGIYNAGYFEVNNSEEAILFLRWWKARLVNYCYSFKLPLDHIFVDQSWLNLVPFYFRGTYIVRHLGYNTSFYNLHERKISKVGNSYLINGTAPLVFFHFTGYKYYQHEKVSIYNPSVTYEDTPFLEAICAEYREGLIKNFIEITSPPLIADKNEKMSPIKFVGKLINFALKSFFKIKIVSTKQEN